MKNLLFILVLIFPFVLISNDQLVDNRKASIHFNPLPMFDYSPRYRIGFSYLSNNKLAYSLDFAYGNSVINGWRPGMSNSKDYSSFEIRPEIQYYIKRSDVGDLYLSSELFFLKVNDVYEEGEYGLNNTTINYDRADFCKTKYGTHLKLGFIYRYNDNLFFNFYAGIGAAKRIIEYSNVINPIEIDGPLFTEWIPQPQLYEGENTLVHLTAGFKIGWVIWKSK